MGYRDGSDDRDSRNGQDYKGSSLCCFLLFPAASCCLCYPCYPCCPCNRGNGSTHPHRTTRRRNRSKRTQNLPNSAAASSGMWRVE